MNILEHAEAIAFYAELDGDSFADYILKRDTVTIDDKEFKISEFFTTDNLKGIWDGAMDAITDWIPEAPENKRKEYAMWLSQGFAFGVIWGKGEGGT